MNHLLGSQKKKKKKKRNETQQNVKVLKLEGKLRHSGKAKAAKTTPS